MTCIEKFTFSRSFPAFPGTAGKDDGGAVPQPVHSVDDLARARSEAHAAGYGEGYAAGLAVGHEEAAAAAHAAREQRELEVLAQLCEHLEQAVGERDTIAVEAESGALALALTGLRKSLPELHRRHGADEIAAMIAELPASPAGLVTLNVMVHPDFADALGDRLVASAAGLGLGNRLSVTGDPGLAAGDCRIAWSGGGAERRLSALMSRINDIVETIAGESSGGTDTEYLRSTERHG